MYPGTTVASNSNLSDYNFGSITSCEILINVNLEALKGEERVN
jgi:hypothetical protein